MPVLEGKTAIITGGGRGIGRGVALAFAKEGARVAIAEIDVDAGRAVAAELIDLGADAIHWRCDIRSSAEVDEFVAKTNDLFGSIDILVNNAIAADINVPVAEVQDASIDLALDTGPKATLYFMRASYPYLADRGGRIINLRSGSEIQGLAGYSTYVAAKAAVGGITRVAAREWGRSGITVNAICPFALDPDRIAIYESTPDRLAAIHSTLSIPRIGDPEFDIGRAAVFLAGPDAGFITGTTLMVDGGGSFLG